MTLILPISYALNRIGTYFQEQTQARMDDHATLVGEWVKNMRLVRFLSWDESFERRLHSAIRNFMKPAIGLHLIACLVFGFSTTWWMVTGTSVLLFSNLFHYPLDITGFFGSLWLLTFIAGYFTHLPNTLRLWALATPSINRISKLLSEPEQDQAFEKGNEGPGLPQAWIPKKIIFDEVGFVYPGGLKALQNINVEIRLHQKTAILGEVGSGKTTFLKLLCGEFPPSSGTIWVEDEKGFRRSLWDKSSHEIFRNALALVPQVPYVSSEALSTNIDFASEHDEADLLLSIQKAEMREDIAQLEDGLHQMIGESGVNLSGGQRQRLNLARAFHSKRPYLVLDDTLSAVDLRTEAALMERLCKDESQGVLLVTHRLSEIRRLGYVLVFQNGRLIEEGKPEILGSNPRSAFTKALEAYHE
jgi:ABC-type multidrug transport system fused ATPase/permease subunit